MGADNGEVEGEGAAMRLRWALGFGADRMYSVQLICLGCWATLGGAARRRRDRVEPAAVDASCEAAKSKRRVWSAGAGRSSICSIRGLVALRPTSATH